MSRWTTHKKKWSNCKKCELWKTRKKVVLLRGKLPCDVLMIGEAPGASENVVGNPFVGPAGKLLNGIISEATEDVSWRFAFTNLVACIPLDEDSNKISEPSKSCIRKCRNRLREVVRLARPQAIVRIGKLSTTYATPEHLGTDELEESILFADIIHPAAILRADESQKGLAVQRSIVTLRDTLSELVPF